MGASFSGKTYDRDEQLGWPVSDSSINTSEPLPPLNKWQGPTSTLTTGEPSFMLFTHKFDLPSIGKSFLGIPFASADYLGGTMTVECFSQI